MNEKFGFLSNFPGIKVNLKKKNGFISKQGELTDNPLLVQRELILTDDESDEDGNDQHRKISVDPGRRTSQLFPRKQQSKPVVNRILESSSSSNAVANNADKTFCSDLEEIVNLQKRDSNLLSQSDNFKALEPQNKISISTVAGPFLDEELSTRLSEMSVKDKRASKKIKNFTDTVVGGFSDVSEDDEPQPGQSKKPISRLADTIVQSSSDDDAEFLHKKPLPVIIKPRVPKPSLPDTIIGFSESLSGLSIHGREPISERKEDEVVTSSEESEFEDDVITILDSDEEGVSEINDLDEPPILNSIESFHNCSSVDIAERKTESDSTVNKFFNNPPLISSPSRFVTHSDIQQQRKAPTPAPAQIKNTSPSTTADRFMIRKTIEHEQSKTEGSFVAEDIMLPETDISETNESFEDEKVSSEDENAKDVSCEDVDADTVPSEIVRSDATQLQSKQTTQNHRITQGQTSINVSAKININVKISMRQSSSSSSSDSTQSSESSSNSSSSGDSEPSPPVRKATPTKKFNTPKQSTSKKVDSTRKEKQAAAPGSGKKRISKPNESPALAIQQLTSGEAPNDGFLTPSKPVEPIVIDDDLQEILNSLYGETWKTPQLLRSCKSKSVRQDLRKSIHANNFDHFVKNLPMDFESTRVATDEKKKNKISLDIKSTKSSFVTPVRINTAQAKESTSAKKKPTNSAKKTPRQIVSSDSDDETPVKTKEKATTAVKRTPIYSEICDSDTLSEDSSSGSDFDANETWNASSDEEYENEQERIKKRTIARQSRKFEEVLFVADENVKDKTKKMDDLLDRFEYKKPLVMDSPRVIKKKLFTHSHYNDELNFDDTIDDHRKEKEKEKENEKPALELRKIFRSPFPVNKKVKEIKSLDRPSPLKTPKTKISTPKPPPLKVVNNFTNYSFLKSLDCEMNPILCNPDALFFRQNFKSKKLELTDTLFKLYNDKVFDGQLSDVPVKWNKKLLNTAGRCNNSRRNLIRKSLVELSDKVLTSADRLRCTLIHEMCHAATWILHAENGHGATWKKWAAKANAVFPELPKINVCHDYVIEYKYTYQCCNCKAKYQTHSKSKKVENVRCSICRGAIELFLNKKNKAGDIVMTPVSKDVKGFAKFVQKKFKEVKQPNMTHKEVMQILSSQYAQLTVDEKQNL